MRRVPVVTTVCVLAALLIVVLWVLMRMPDPIRAHVVHVDVATSGPVRSYPQ